MSDNYAMNYYYKHQKKIKQYQLNLYYKYKDRINEKRRLNYAKKNPYCNPYNINFNNNNTIIFNKGIYEINFD